MPIDPETGERFELAAQNRRRHARTSIDRPVGYLTGDFSGFLREGRAVDISLEGMRIHTSRPESVNSDIQIELYPEEGAAEEAPILLRGRVVWVKEHAGEWAMGVHLKSNPAAAQFDLTEGPRFSKSDDSVERVEDRKDAGERRVRFGPAKPQGLFGEQGRKFLWIFYLVLVVLLFALAWWLQTAFDEESPQGPAGGPGLENGEQPPVVEPEASRPSGGFVFSSQQEYRRADVEQLLSLGQAMLIADRAEDAGRVFAQAREAEAATPMQGFMARLGEAQAAAIEGEFDAAFAALDGEYPEDGIPAAWAATVDMLRRALLVMKNENTPMPMLKELVTFEAPEDTWTAKANPVEIEIDTSEHTLTVTKNGAAVRSFPVGLGVNGATPLGNFRIANKLTDPAWFNRGEVVPAGDPANPIGKRWMGLGANGAATSYGIHPTEDGGSVGANASEGCVRMFPEDAETLFRLVPKGAPVVIR